MSDSFDLGDPSQPDNTAYRVLARKYRPQNFDQLIGQDAMVQTLANAIRRGRLAHAFLLTGVRGVGKTSTARLIAKALNCIGTDGQGGPTIDPCGVCEPCVSIAEGRNIDVIEIDAASHNGIDDVRAMTDAVRYTAVSARYKMYIIDEVHMMSKPAFNALLKTLEEPPSHVKFLLATTEVEKVPVTVLSRCQRFDLRRIPAVKLAAHFAKVSELEGAEAEPEALALIARAADGSARDGLSILDQAIAHAGMEGGGVTAPAVRAMLGLSDRAAIRDMFGLLLASDAPSALGALRTQYDLGVDPQSVLRGLLETVHATTLAKLGGDADPAQSADEREAYRDWARALSFPALHRLWQLLLKGHDEVGRAALPIEAGEMALLRVVHASSLPDPGELAKQIASGAPPAATASAATAPAPANAPVQALPATFDDMVALIQRNGGGSLLSHLNANARPVRYAPPELTLSTQRPLPADLPGALAARLHELTGVKWKIATEDAEGEATLAERRKASEQTERTAILETPMVKAAFEAFPDAVLENWNKEANL